MSKVEIISRLRKDTGATFTDVKKSLEDTDFVYEKALELLKSWGSIPTTDRDTPHGRVETYNHNNRIGVVLQVNCQTDFVARTTEFQTLCKELAMHVVATNPESPEKMLDELYVRDPSKTVKDWINLCSSRCGETIKVVKFYRIEL